MFLRIAEISEKKLIGQRMNMSYIENKIVSLWQKFMPRRKEILNRSNTDLFSLQIYDKSFSFKQVNPHISFEKWAAVEVSDFEKVPDEMETLTLEGGKYAVFLHKGISNEAARHTFAYIWGEWLPNSGYVIDDRPHFEILGEKYSRSNPGIFHNACM